MQKKLTLAMLILFCLCAPIGAEATQSITGKWLITGELVTSSAEDPNNPYAPKPGTKLQDVWVIGKANNGSMLLQTPKTTMPGQVYSNYLRFQGDYNLQMGLRLRVTIDVAPNGAGGIWGTEELIYYAPGSPITSREAWKFTGVQAQ